MYTYNVIINKINSLAKKINVPKTLLDSLQRQNQYAQPYIEIKFPFYYLVVSENGREIKRQKFKNAEGLMFAVFEELTFVMAIQYELMHRVMGKDSRRIIFSYQLELMEKISIKWKDILQVKINQILRDNPYNDKNTGDGSVC